MFTLSFFMKNMKKNIQTISLIKYRQSLILTLYIKNITALQSALCSDQSHFSRFECYPKKDKVKNILIFFGYSAKTNKSQSFIVIYFNDNESIKIYFKKSHIGIQSHFLWKETLGNLQTAPTPAKQL